MEHSENCLQMNVEEKACYLRFGPQKVAGALALRWETVREESVVIDLTAEGQIIGIELFKPGMKPCQPLWSHTKPLDLEKQIQVEHPKEPPTPKDEEEPEDEGGGNPQQKG